MSLCIADGDIVSLTQGEDPSVEGAAIHVTETRDLRYDCPSVIPDPGLIAGHSNGP